MFGFNKNDVEKPINGQDKPMSEDSRHTAENPITDNTKIATESAHPTTSAPSNGRFFKQAPAQILKPSIISEGFELVGDITSPGGLHVEGKINGNIQVDNMAIGAKGVVKGTVKCQVLHIKGRFDGEAVCGSLNLSGDAIVNGDIQYSDLTMATGTILTGNLRKS